MTVTQTTLQNAARAIECDLWTDPSGANYLAKDGAILRRWEPLADDGDALRLAVKLGLTINIMLRDEEGYSSSSVWGVGQCRENARQGDHCLATRAAILKMAAKIGAAL